MVNQVRTPVLCAVLDPGARCPRKQWATAPSGALRLARGLAATDFQCFPLINSPPTSVRPGSPVIMYNGVTAPAFYPPTFCQHEAALSPSAFECALCLVGKADRRYIQQQQQGALHTHKTLLSGKLVKGNTTALRVGRIEGRQYRFYEFNPFSIAREKASPQTLPRRCRRPPAASSPAPCRRPRRPYPPP